MTVFVDFFGIKMRELFATGVNAAMHMLASCRCALLSSGKFDMRLWRKSKRLRFRLETKEKQEWLNRGNYHLS